MNVTVCIGSSCHIKGSRIVVEQLQTLIARYQLGDQVELGGSFCMGRCQSAWMWMEPSIPSVPKGSRTFLTNAFVRRCDT